MTLEDLDQAVSNILKSLPPKPAHMTTAEHERQYALRRVAALEAVESVRRPELNRLKDLVAKLRGEISQLTTERDHAVQKRSELEDQVKCERQRADAALTLANAHDAEAAGTRG